MKNIKQIIVTNIKWDAPKSASLPKRVVIDINEDNQYQHNDIVEIQNSKYLVLFEKE